MTDKVLSEKCKQKILVFQQNKSGESKIKGIKKYGQGFFKVKTISIDDVLPPILDDTRQYLPQKIQADIVLDFLKHPDLSCDLGEICQKQNIPVVASGKKIKVKGVITPPT